WYSTTSPLIILSFILAIPSSIID
ncbi:hypothetical protein D039_0362B, partial [Vibrio parahaemolyticus EKP-028]